MASITVKERERERERDRWETESVRSSRSAPRNFTTVRRYKIPEDVDEEDTHITVRESHTDNRLPREWDRDPRDRVEYRIVQRERDVDDDRASHYSGSHYSRSERPRETEVKEDIRIRERRGSSRSSSPEIDVRIRREVDRGNDRLRPEPQSPYTLERYSKSTEYFSRPEPQPLPIVIREERPAPQPIIIREEAPPPQQIIVQREVEPSYEIIEKDEVEEQQIARREPQEPEYYYERRVRQLAPRQRYVEEDRYERERERGRDYYSDDDAVYVRREYEVDDDGRGHGPKHRRHLAEGAVAGIAASQILRHHRKRQGEDPGSRIGQVVGYGALGAVGTEAVSRFKQWNDRDRSRSRERGGREKSRHRSLSRGKAIAGVAALAGLGALAYAAGKKGNKSGAREGPRRSRSRRRRSSVRDHSDEETKHLDPDHRNRSVAKAGLVGAVAAGLAQRARSKSRGGRSRSKSRVRESLPIVAAGLGSAAVAGLYERQKAKKEGRRARSRSQSYSRSRSRSRSVSHSAARGAPSDTALVEYGGDPIYSTATMDRQRSRSRSASRGRHHRHHSSSTASSPDRRHGKHSSRSRSRGQGLAEAALAAGAAGVAVNEVNKRRERRRAEKERLRKLSLQASGPDRS
jgi:hypothetical protein